MEEGKKVKTFFPLTPALLSFFFFFLTLVTCLASCSAGCLRDGLSLWQHVGVCRRKGVGGLLSCLAPERPANYGAKRGGFSERLPAVWSHDVCYHGKCQQPDLYVRVSQEVTATTTTTTTIIKALHSVSGCEWICPLFKGLVGCHFFS